MLWNIDNKSYTAWVFTGLASSNLGTYYMKWSFIYIFDVFFTFWSDQNPQAEQAYKKAIEIEPNNPLAWKVFFFFLDFQGFLLLVWFYLFFPGIGWTLFQNKRLTKGCGDLQKAHWISGVYYPFPYTTSNQLNPLLIV